MKTLRKFIRDLRVTEVGVWLAMATIVALTVIFAAVLVAVMGRCWATGILTTLFMVGAATLFYRTHSRWLREAGVDEAEIASGVALIRGWARAYWAWARQRIGKALDEATEEAARDVGMLQSNISEVVPGRVKVFARTWWGAVSIYMGAILLCLASGAFWALLFGRHDIIAAMVFVDIVALVAITSAFLLRWDEEGWEICPCCDQPTPGGYFCAQCGVQLRNPPVTA